MTGSTPSLSNPPALTGISARRKTTFKSSQKAPEQYVADSDISGTRKHALAPDPYTESPVPLKKLKEVAKASSTTPTSPRDLQKQRRELTKHSKGRRADTVSRIACEQGDNIGCMYKHGGALIS